MLPDTRVGVIAVCQSLFSRKIFFPPKRWILNHGAIQYRLFYFLKIIRKQAFVFVCAGSLLLHGLFSSCGERGTGLSLWGFSCYRARALGLLDVSSWSTWAQQALLTGCRAQAQQLRCADPVAPRHVGSS